MAGRSLRIDIPADEAEWQRRATVKRPIRETEKYLWVTSELPPRSSARAYKSITYFGKNYELRDHSTARDTIYIAVPRYDVSQDPKAFCVHFASSQVTHVQPFLKGLEECVSIHNVDDILTPVERESLWRYSRVYGERGRVTEYRHGPVMQPLPDVTIGQRLRLIRKGGQPVDIAMEWTIPKVINLDDYTANEPIEGPDEEAPTHLLDWQILSLQDVSTYLRILERERAASTDNSKKELVREQVDRISFLRSLKPECWWKGEHNMGAVEYLIAQFPKCVIAESPTYGNAIYYYPTTGGGTPWQDLFRYHTRKEIRGMGARQIRHYEGWQEVLRALLRIEA